jgi:hypothetical protein
MHDQAGGLVDDQHVLVLVAQVEWHRLRTGLGVPGEGRPHDHGLSALHAIAGAPRRAIHLDLARFDPALEPAP